MTYYILLLLLNNLSLPLSFLLPKVSSFLSLSTGERFSYVAISPNTLKQLSVLGVIQPRASIDKCFNIHSNTPFPNSFSDSNTKPCPGKIIITYSFPPLLSCVNEHSLASCLEMQDNSFWDAFFFFLNSFYPSSF